MTTTGFVIVCGVLGGMIALGYFGLALIAAVIVFAACCIDEVPQ